MKGQQVKSLATSTSESASKASAPPCFAVALCAIWRISGGAIGIAPTGTGCTGIGIAPWYCPLLRVVIANAVTQQGRAVLGLARYAHAAPLLAFDLFCWAGCRVGGGRATWELGHSNKAGFGLGYS